MNLVAQFMYRHDCYTCTLFDVPPGREPCSSCYQGFSLEDFKYGHVHINWKYSNEAKIKNELKSTI